MVLKVIEKPKIIFSSRLTSAIFSLTVGVLLAKFYSTQGIALTIAISAFISWILLRINLNKFLNINT
jgi:1,4-dihydroxy-2-naphthoate octaprenyltransferase